MFSPINLTSEYIVFSQVSLLAFHLLNLFMFLRNLWKCDQNYSLVILRIKYSGFFKKLYIGSSLIHQLRCKSLDSRREEEIENLTYGKNLIVPNTFPDMKRIYLNNIKKFSICSFIYTTIFFSGKNIIV